MEGNDKKSKPSIDVNRWRIEERLRIVLNYRENLTADINQLIEDDVREVYAELHDSISKVINVETQLLKLKNKL